MSEISVYELMSKKRKEKELNAIVEKIKKHTKAYQRQLSQFKNDQNYVRKFFTAKTEMLRNELKTKISDLGFSEEEALKSVLPKAYALVQTASWYLWSKPHYDCQLIGGILLNDGYASQMATGEGKTLTAALPAYLNALLEKGCHVITPNAYLAMRDAKEMGQLYNLLGLSCGLVEERDRPSDEEIDQKTEKILMARYGNSPRSKELVAKVREEAFRSIKKEQLQKKREAYAADITYGSASAIAFDYLFDDIAKDNSDVVQRTGNPNFAIIDEVDAVLVDDAITPFTISGSIRDEEMAISKEDIKKENEVIELINLAFKFIYTQHEKTIFDSRGADSLIATFNDYESFDAVVSGDAKNAEYFDMTKAILIDQNTGRIQLTTLGETILFKYFNAREINNLLTSNSEKIIKMRLNGKPLYVEGVDYEFDEKGYLVMEPRAFAHLVTSSAIPELSLMYEKFGSDYENENLKVIENAARAWFILENNKDYKLNRNGDGNTYSVSLVLNGRTAEGRVYSNGLQQAIEEKEQSLNKKLKIKKSRLKDEIASIPTASFFARYEKFAGMTGTAAVEAFRDLYGLETYEVPRNNPSRVVDQGDVFYATTEKKNEAIFQEVKRSHALGQPVLISTTSIEESEKLYAYLQRRFREENIEVNIPVLNANVDKLEEEAKIISKAGMPGAITIATEMAGRGTDIKLGGELPPDDKLYSSIVEESVEKTLSLLKKNMKIDIDDKEKMAALRQRVYVKVIANQKSIHRIMEERKQLKDKVLASGGLKVIGCGHFDSARVDNQVKGRCGRQGDIGKIIFFSDPDDLLRIGVDTKVVEKFRKMARNGPIVDNVDEKDTPIYDAVYETQMRKEEDIKKSIEIQHKIEGSVAHYRKRIHLQKEYLRNNDDYIDSVSDMIDGAIQSIVEASSDSVYPDLRKKTKIKKANLNLEDLSSMLNEFLDIQLSPEQIQRFVTVGELVEYLSQTGKNKLAQLVSANGSEQSKICKEIVDKMIDRSWYQFEATVDAIKMQASMNGMTGSISDKDLSSQIVMAYNHSIRTQRAMIVREVLNPDYRVKYGDKARTELFEMRMTSQGYRRVSHTYDSEVEKEMADLRRESVVDRTRSVKNLQLHPRIYTLFEKTKLRRLPHKLNNGMTESNSDEVETVDFNDSTGNKKR